MSAVDMATKNKVAVVCTGFWEIFTAECTGFWEIFYSRFYWFLENILQQILPVSGKYFTADCTSFWKIFYSRLYRFLENILQQIDYKFTVHHQI